MIYIKDISIKIKEICFTLNKPKLYEGQTNRYEV